MPDGDGVLLAPVPPLQSIQHLI
uniref:Uncharacterized protein n=1 Tax=Arundo donax TaxID=35708 RepID=A0A0A9CL93_ARUDO